MKRLLLWTLNVTLLMVASATTAMQEQAGMLALGGAELNSITAGWCTTCNNGSNEPAGPPTIIGEGWDPVSQRTSGHTYTSRRTVQQIVNESHTTTANYSFSYNDECRHVLTGGSVSLGRGLGLSIGFTYHCDQNRTLSFSVAPRGVVTLYDGTKSYFVTHTYRHYLLWSDGYRERTGLTETLRDEYSYYYMEIR